jgi:hypothetical protein
MFEITIQDLPPEIHSRMLVACGLRDMEALGATCQSMRAVARDPLLWRGLFERDYGHLYPTRVKKTTHPTGAVLRDPWVDSVCQEWGVGAPSVRLPPSGQGWLPQPFMHMQSAGKDARWLYAFHATNSHVSGNLPPSLAGLYTVRFDKSHDSWTERGTHDDASTWSVAVTPSAMALEHTIDGHPTSRVTTHHITESICWTTGPTTLPTLLFRIQAPSIEPKRQALVRSACLKINRTKTRERSEYSDGTITNHTFRDQQETCVTRYPNGDCVHYGRANGRITSIERFVCSKDCPAPEFAGRSLCPGDWRWSTAVLAADDSDEHYYWPKGECKDALAFRDYVLRDLIGWHPLLRDIALSSMDDDNTI